MAKEWLEDELKHPEFQRLVEHEDFIERALDGIDALMRAEGIARDDLARRMGCTKKRVMRLFRRDRKVTLESLIDMAFHVGYRFRFHLEPLARTTPLEYRDVLDGPAGDGY